MSLTIERVTHKTNRDSSTNTSVYIPQITTLTAPRPPHASTLGVSDTNPFDDVATTVETTTNNQSSTEISRDFEAGDIVRVMDFDNLPDPPNNAKLLMLLEDFEGNEDGSFPERYVCLRGSYLFYFDVNSIPIDPNSSDTDNIPTSDLGSSKPLGCVPLSRTKIEFPQGGRGVFRQHSNTVAKTGYEFVIKHTGDEPKNRSSMNSNENDLNEASLRPSVYVVVGSLSQRDEWANAIRLRAEIRKRDTGLRPGVVRENKNNIDTTTFDPNAANKKSSSLLNSSDTRRMDLDMIMNNSDLIGTTPLAVAASGNDDKVINEQFLKDAIRLFGVAQFDEKMWLHKFYEQNNEFDAPKQFRTLEDYQSTVKQGLRGAVLEQYEYFVEASREMTTMGREINTLKTLVDGQLRLIDQLKKVEFSDFFRYGQGADFVDSDSSDDERNFRTIGGVISPNDNDNDDDASLSSVDSDQSSVRGGWTNMATKNKNKRNNNRTHQVNKKNNSNAREDNINAFEIPNWLEDVTEDISAYIKECRYTDATDLILKAKTELAEISSQHEKLTDRRLSKQQLNTIHQTTESITDLTKLMAGRLAEALRRKNEAFRQLSKRERADPLSEYVPLLSPICLNDDDTTLQLLVKLGFFNDAAEAYAARRSLLLMESLNERPISSEGRLDVVINAAQLSQSFFSCLAMTVEGFLDLFIMGTSGWKTSIDDTSIQSNPSRKVPPGALASIVLWCDSELVKFANIFGGPKILGQLELLLPLNMENKTNHLDSEGNLDDKVNLRSEEEKSEFEAAEKLKVKLVTEEQDNEAKEDMEIEGKRDRERKRSINVAAQCIDQAFQFASENLDMIGLPLTPRLADCLRLRLRGCEAQVAELLQNRWGHFVFDWFAPLEKIHSESGMYSQWRRSKTNISMLSPDDM